MAEDQASVAEAVQVPTSRLRGQPGGASPTLLHARRLRLRHARLWFLRPPAGRGRGGGGGHGAGESARLRGGLRAPDYPHGGRPRPSAHGWPSQGLRRPSGPLGRRREDSAAGDSSSCKGSLPFHLTEPLPRRAPPRRNGARPMGKGASRVRPGRISCPLPSPAAKQAKLFLKEHETAIVKPVESRGRSGPAPHWILT
jgi:hypothetical protein